MKKFGLIACLLTSVGMASGHAQSVWSGTGSSAAWLTTGNWTGGVPGSTGIAQFGLVTSSGSTVGINMNTSGGNQQVGAIEFTSARTSTMIIGNSSTTVNGILTLNSATVNSVTNVILRNNSGQDMILQNRSNSANSGTQTMGVALGSAADNKMVIDGAGDIQISSIISGTNKPLTVLGTGSGVVEFTGVNTFTGAVNVLGSELRVNSNSALGGANNNIVIDGGRLATTSGTSFTMAATHNMFVGNGTGTAISVTTSGTLTYGGVIANKTGEVGGFAKQGAGVLALGGVSTYTGNTDIQQGTLQLTTGDNRLPTGTVVSLGQASSANLGTLDLNGNDQAIAGLNSVSGTNATTGNNTVTSSAAAILTVGGSGTYVYGAGTNANSGIITGSISLVKNGSGSLTLGDANTYSGGTTINAGTLSAGNNTALGSGAVTVNSGGTLVIQSGFNLNNTVKVAGGTYNKSISSGTAYSYSATSSFTGGQADTQARIVAGSTGAARSLSTSFSNTSVAGNDEVRTSDIFNLSGTGTDVFTLQLQVTGITADSILGWNNSGTWVNAVDGNIGTDGSLAMGYGVSWSTFLANNGGTFNATNMLGAYGYDITTNTVWAVIDHNSEFAAIAAVPEPSTYILLGMGLGTLWILRRMRKGQSRI